MRFSGSVDGLPRVGRTADRPREPTRIRGDAAQSNCPRTATTLRGRTGNQGRGAGYRCAGIVRRGGTATHIRPATAAHARRQPTQPVATIRGDCAYPDRGCRCTAQIGRQIDTLAADLEDQQQFDEAESLRILVQSVRAEARRLESRSASRSLESPPQRQLPPLYQYGAPPGVPHGTPYETPQGDPNGPTYGSGPATLIPK